MRRIVGVALILFGLFLFVAGTITATGWGNEADLSTGGRVSMGVIFAMLGLFTMSLGWPWLRR